jgi:hypothetical protein
LLRVLPGVDQIRPALNTFVGVETKKTENYTMFLGYDAVYFERLVSPLLKNLLLQFPAIKK